MDAEFQELVELLEELIVVVLLLRDLREHHEAHANYFGFEATRLRYCQLAARLTYIILVCVLVLIRLCAYLECALCYALCFELIQPPPFLLHSFVTVTPSNVLRFRTIAFT